MSFELKIKEILSDNYSGSAALLDKIIKSILTYTDNQEVDVSYLKTHLDKINSHFPGLGVLNHFMQQFYDLLDQIINYPTDKKQPKSQISHFISDYIDQWEENIGLAAERMGRLVEFQGKKVLLHSNSYSIHVLFRHLALHKIFPSVYQTTSGPVYEGKIQAELLSNLGCKVHLINEAAIARFIQEIDLAVMGADNVFDDGFTNRTGTNPLAVVCRKAGKPFYVMADSRKRTPVGYQIHLEALSKVANLPETPESKIPFSTPPAHHYLEFTPLNLVTAIFFEDTWWNLAEK